MAVRTWQDVDGNWANTANWSGGAVPVDTDTIVIATGNKDIASGMDQSAVDPAAVYFGEDFSGTVGTPASPLKLGTVTMFRYNASLCQSFNFWPATCTTGVIEATHSIADAFYGSAGTWTKLIVLGGPSIRFGAATVLTAATIGQRRGSATPIGVTIDSGVTLTAVRLSGGHVWCEAAAVTLEILGQGVWDHEGASTYDITTLNISGGRFNWKSAAGTITKVNAYGGVFDGSLDPRSKTITNMDAYAGAYVNINNGVNTITCTNPPVDHGCGIIGLVATTQIAGGPSSPL